ncbi:MAG TPA: cytochrome c biogenesis CcdA family protein [Xanthobacteraceae bacterium]|nr:cytochrome c biogenesis CcdA family protein [Xanthobacteraceae bacterium]
MAVGSLPLSFVAGGLSTLSPCVLPILPIVLGAAASERKWGPAALAAGLSVSFVAIGLFIATVGFAMGLDADVFRYVAATLMVVIGSVLVLPRLAAPLVVAEGPIAAWADRQLEGLRANGIVGQFAIGVLLGAVWSPCVGPTLGAASLLAAQGRDLGEVAIVMLAFGAGAALPLLALGLFSREAMMRGRHALASAGHGMKVALGLTFMAIGVLVLTGLDKTVETALVEASPSWLTDLTTRL